MSANDAAQEFQRLYFRSEAADAAGSRDEAVQLVRQLYKLVEDNRRFFGHNEAPLVGNAAVTAETYRENELADQVYQMALQLDAKHANNIQNYVDFIVKAQLTERYDLARTYLDELESEHPDHKPTRTQSLRFALNELTGSGVALDEQQIAAVLDDFRRDPGNRDTFGAAMTLLDQIHDFEHIREVARTYYQAARNDDARYFAVRGYADVLAGSPDERHEREAMDIYRYLLDDPSALSGSDGQAPRTRAAALHNFATLLYKHDYDDLAGEYWFHAYRLDPGSDKIRTSYSLYLLRAKRPDVGSLVAEGKPVEETVLQPRIKEVPARFAPEAEEDPWWRGGAPWPAAPPGA